MKSWPRKLFITLIDLDENNTMIAVLCANMTNNRMLLLQDCVVNIEQTLEQLMINFFFLFFFFKHSS